MAAPTITARTGIIPVAGEPGLVPLFSDFTLSGVESGATYNNSVLELTAAGNSNDAFDFAYGILTGDGVTTRTVGGHEQILYNGQVVAVDSSSGDSEFKLTFTSNADSNIVGIVADHIGFSYGYTGYYPPTPTINTSFGLLNASSDDTAELSYSPGGAANDDLGKGVYVDQLLAGAAGDDMLHAGAHNVVADGGDGSDTLVVDGGANMLVIDLGSTTAQALAYSGSTVTLSSVENLTATYAGNVSAVTGTDEANRIAIVKGTIEGQGGDDTLSASSGTLDGGDGNDTAVLQHGSTVDLRVSGVQAGVQLISIENLTGSASDDTLYGDDNANVLLGGKGKDHLYGNGGDDVLDGQVGNDYLDGGDGDDLLIGTVGNSYRPKTMVNGGDGIDTFDYSAKHLNPAAQVAIDLETSTYIVGVENVIGSTSMDTLDGTEGRNKLVGNDGDDVLNGHGGNDTLGGGDGNDMLDGGTGADTMRGGKGDDTFKIDDIADTVIEAANQGKDQVITTVDYTLAENVENIRAATSVDEGLMLTGNVLRNIIKGADGDDTLIGAGGKDTLTGGLGHDIFRYETASDSLAGGANRDTITDFTQGDDVIDLSALAPSGGSLSFIGTAAFDHQAGEVRYNDGGASTYVSVDLDGDGKADMQIALSGLYDLTRSDFLLSAMDAHAI